jgi:hypothetical protein
MAAMALVLVGNLGLKEWRLDACVGGGGVSCCILLSFTMHSPLKLVQSHIDVECKLYGRRRPDSIS